MKKNLLLRLCLMIAFVLSLNSCRNDLLQEQQHRNDLLQEQQHTAFNPNTSKFRIVDLKDIPKVEKFIHQKTGKADFSLPYSSGILSKNAAEFGEIETDFIIEAVQGEDTYYVFKVADLDAAQPEDTYNFLVKQTNGILQTANIVAYKPEDEAVINGQTDFDHFSGKVQSMDLQGNLLASMDYNNGSSDCPDFTDNEGGESSGGGGVDEGGTITPTDPYPEPTDPPIVGGPSNPNEPETGESGCWSIDIDSQGGTVGYYNSCTNQYISVSFQRMGKQLSSGCNNGPGVVIDDAIKNPCAKIKAHFDNVKFKEKYDKLTKTSPSNENVFDLNHELAVYMRFPTVGTNTPPAFVDVDLPDCATDGNLPSFEEGMGGLMHTHNNESCNGGTTIKAPSPTDIQTFINILMRETMQYTGSYANAYSLVTTSGGNYMLMYSGTNYPGSINYNQWKLLQTEYEKVFTLLYSDKENVTQADIEKLFTKFMKEKVNKPGLDIYRVTPDSKMRIEYDPTSPNSVKEIPCP